MIIFICYNAEVKKYPQMINKWNSGKFKYINFESYF